MPSRRPISLAVAPSRPIACIANPWAGRMPGWPWVASSACSASMSARNPPNSSRGSSNPGVRGSDGAGAVTGVGVAAAAGVGPPAGVVGILDNLVYGIDNHIVYRSPAGWPGSRGWRNPMTSFPLPEHTIDSAPDGSGIFPAHTLDSAPDGSRIFPEHTLESAPDGSRRIMEAMARQRGHVLA